MPSVCWSAGRVRCWWHRHGRHTNEGRPSRGALFVLAPIYVNAPGPRKGVHVVSPETHLALSLRSLIWPPVPMDLPRRLSRGFFRAVRPPAPRSPGREAACPSDYSPIGRPPVRSLCCKGSGPEQTLAVPRSAKVACDTNDAPGRLFRGGTNAVSRCAMPHTREPNRTHHGCGAPRFLGGCFVSPVTHSGGPARVRETARVSAAPLDGSPLANGHTFLAVF